MNGRRIILVLTTALIAALFLIACGQTSQRRVPSSAVQPPSINLADALAELDALQAPEGVKPAVFAQLKDSLRTALIVRAVDKIVSAPPSGPGNVVQDLSILDAGGGTAILEWRYRNLGDYNQDGRVSVADVTSLAMHFGESWIIGEENTLPAVVDGSGDGTVNVADVTPIAMNFGVTCAGYNIEESATETGAYSLVEHVQLTSGLDKETARMRFAVTRAAVTTYWYRVVPTDSGLTGGIEGSPEQFISAGTPVASIVPDATTVEIGTLVTFDASGSTDDGTIDLYEWDLDGDGTFDFNTGTTPTTNANYTQVGEYHPSVRVTDNDSLTDTASVTITVTPPNQPPVAALTATPDTGVVQLDVLLDAGGSTDADGTIVKYEWDPNGDGTFELDTGTTSSVNYLYSTIGVYNPAVRVTDDDGDTGVASVPVTVSLTTWATTWGSTGSEYARGLDVSPAGYIFEVGSSDSFEAGPMNAASIIRYDDTGAIVWAKTWGDFNEDIAYDVATDANNNIFIVGGTGSYGAGSYDAFLIKVDASGNLIYQNNWGGVGVDEAHAVAVDNLGNVYVAGVTDYNLSGSDFFLYKFDEFGVMVWRRVWSNFGFEAATNLAVDTAGDIYVVGYSDNFGDGVLVRYDPSGTLLWQKTWGGSNAETPYDVAVDSAGNVYVTGETDSFGAGGYDVYLIKYDSSGALLWQQLWGGSSFDSPTRLAINNATGDVFVAGGTTSFSAGDTDAFVLQYNDSGALLKQVAWGGAAEDKALGLALGPDGALYMSGYSPDAGSTWRTLSGTVTPGTGTAADVGGSWDDPGWNVFSPGSVLVDQVGVIDTGGGSNDDLLVKANPDVM